MDKELVKKCLLTLKEKDKICLRIGVPYKDQWLGVQSLINETAQKQITKAIPIIRKAERERIFTKVDKALSDYLYKNGSMVALIDKLQVLKGEK